MNDFGRGTFGTIFGVFGIALSVVEVQAIIAMCCTVIGFVISVIIPLIVKIYKYYKKRKIGALNEPTEGDDLLREIKEAGESLQSLGREVSESKSEGEKK